MMSSPVAVGPHVKSARPGVLMLTRRSPTATRPARGRTPFLAERRRARDGHAERPRRRRHLARGLVAADDPPDVPEARRRETAETASEGPPLLGDQCLGGGGKSSAPPRAKASTSSPPGLPSTSGALATAPGGAGDAKAHAPADREAIVRIMQTTNMTQEGYVITGKGSTTCVDPAWAAQQLTVPRGGQLCVKLGGTAAVSIGQGQPRLRTTRCADRWASRIS